MSTHHFGFGLHVNEKKGERRRKAERASLAPEERKSPDHAVIAIEQPQLSRAEPYLSS